MTASPLTGNDVADLHHRADQQGFGWRTVDELPTPYVVDPETRIIYLDGQLPIGRYYEALRDGVGELLRRRAVTVNISNVIPFQRRANPVERTG